jgi:ParB family chromosome partitioning protein
MASFKEGMRAMVAGSLTDRPVHGETAGPAPDRSSLQRQGEGRKRMEAACVLRLDRIVADPTQPRTEFDEEGLQQLADSLKERGQLQPIRVRWDGALDRYVVVVGERRFRAAGLAGLETIACVVAAEASVEDILEDQLVENALRLDLKPIEQARAYKRLIDARGLSLRQLADRLRIGHASIARSLALLNLPEAIQESVEAGQIAPNTAYQISKVEDPVEQADLAKQAARGELKRDEIQKKARGPRAAAAKGRGVGKAKAPKTSMTIRLPGGGKVTIEHRRGVDEAAARAMLQEALGKLGGDEEMAEAA